MGDSAQQTPVRIGSSASMGKLPLFATAQPRGSGRSPARRRRISPAAGRAIEILGHAIEYLTDEFVHAGGFPAAHDPQIEAVQLLMALNREIYLACPELPSLASRFCARMRLRTT